MKFRRVLPMACPALDCSGSPSRTRQEFLEDSNINNIVRRFVRSGVLPQPNLGREPVDPLAIPGDFQQACEACFEQLNFPDQQVLSSPADQEKKPVEQASSTAE